MHARADDEGHIVVKLGPADFAEEVADALNIGADELDEAGQSESAGLARAAENAIRNAIIRNSLWSQRDGREVNATGHAGSSASR